MGKHRDDDQTLSDENDDDKRRERKRSKKNDHHRIERNERIEENKLKKKKKQEEGESSDDDDNRDRKQRKKRKHKRKRRRDDDDYSSDSISEDSSSYYQRKKRHKQKKKKRKKSHKSSKKHKKSKRHRHYDSSSSSSENDKEEEELKKLDRNYKLADALYNLLNDHPVMASELPIMLIRMARGSSFDLDRMTNEDAARGLQAVFESLSSYGVEIDPSDGHWKWSGPQGGRKGRNVDLLLVTISRALLDEVGLTMEAIQQYEAELETSAQSNSPNNQSNSSSDLKDQDITNHTSSWSSLQQQTIAVLEQFQSKDSTLSTQLAQLCTMILDGESISIDGIPDEALRDALAKVFQGAGLEIAEMEVESEDENEKTDETNDPSMGYGLPEDQQGSAESNIRSIIDACQHVANSVKPKAPIRGPLPKHLMDQYPETKAATQDSDDDDDEEEGPAPMGSAQARKLVKNHAARRATEISQQNDDNKPKEGEREEWMLQPGQHDLLQSIKSGKVLKSRAFANKRSHQPQAPEQPINPAIRAQVDAIVKAHDASRGPSLMEQHQQLKAEKQQQADKSGTFSWNRDKNLSDGRRADTNALRRMMQGVDGLKDKFEGGYSRNAGR